jgi:hypothetical protein
MEARDLLAPVYGRFTDTLDLKNAKALLESTGAAIWSGVAVSRGPCRIAWANFATSRFALPREVCSGSRLCENSNRFWRRRKLFCPTTRKHSIMLTVQLGLPIGRITFFAFRQRATFHTAWVIKRPSDHAVRFTLNSGPDRGDTGTAATCHRSG